MREPRILPFRRPLQETPTADRLLKRLVLGVELLLGGGAIICLTTAALSLVWAAVGLPLR